MSAGASQPGGTVLSIRVDGILLAQPEIRDCRLPVRIHSPRRR
jgi:hypothetical protein